MRLAGIGCSGTAPQRWSSLRRPTPQSLSPQKKGRSPQLVKRHGIVAANPRCAQLRRSSRRVSGSETSGYLSVSQAEQAENEVPSIARQSPSQNRDNTEQQDDKETE